MTSILDINQIEIAQSWLADGHKMALAIVTRTWGSSPRQAGAIMLIRDDSVISGSVSGGCIEGKVISEAMNLWQAPTHLCLSEGVEDETAWSQGLSCGGQIDLMILPVHPDYISVQMITEMARITAQRGTATLQLYPQTGQAHLYKTPPSQAETDSQDFLLFSIAPKRQLIIIGAGHISQHLARMAQQSDFDVTIIDPRSIFITPARFPHCHLIDEWPETALATFPLDEQTALITLTHDPRIDDQALMAGLRNTPFHIAALGSKRTHEKRQKRLQEAGFDSKDIARIKGPAGLAIGAKSPAEIALSILAEIISHYRGGQSR